MMVHNNDVAFHRALVHQRNEASLELLAFLPGTKIAARVELRPCRALLRQRLNLSSVSEFGRLLPISDDLKVGDFFQSIQDRLIFSVVDLLTACIVAPSLHVAD